MERPGVKGLIGQKLHLGEKKGKFLHLVPQNGTLQLNGHSLALIGGNNPGPTAPATKALTSIF